MSTRTTLYKPYLTEYNPPVRNVGMINGNKVINFSQRQDPQNNYDPFSDPYYTKTAYATSQPHVKRIFSKDSSTKYPLSKIYKRLTDNLPITGDDYYAGRDTATVLIRTKMTKNDTMIAKPTKEVLDRQENAFKNIYFNSKYNHASKFYLLATLGYIMTVFAPFIMLFGIIALGYYAGLYSTWMGFFQNLGIVAIWTFCSFIFWKLFAWLGRHTPDNKVTKLCRRTGMISFAQKGNKPDVELPFAEFEPRIFTGTSPGGFYHQLVYVHKSGKAIVKCGERFIVDVYLKMAYIEQFMDITKPLPDMPNLEWCRDKDPTTAAYDKANNRPANYWRDKTGQEIDKIRDEHQEKIKSIISQHAYNL